MSFVLSGFMLYTMWVVLALIAIDLLVTIYTSFQNNSFSLSLLSNFLSGILNYVFPLFIVVNLMPLDPTGWLIKIAYYVGAIGVIFRYLVDIKNRM
jgi:hypothetical protein